MSNNTRFIGGREFANAIRKMKSSKRKMISEEVTKSAFRIEKSAKEKAAVDTGNMRKNIQAEKIGEFTARVDSRAPYSVYVDKGTRYQAAQPFFTPAVDEEEKKFNQNVKGIINK
ncbi:HK97-gp10 family putative phage morphogenesis protein [Latilactobacillus fragifolii]|uniref:HK97-gp10 family putative phage morphogenesis protein n=1 Tax=Latilactobacillus fragifolii TaxID=2814244 RepID=UPI001ABBD413|nr:HK97-gp10 family putative phage morphogenesis protein [Latilactobacillus fragifolii]